MNNSTEPGHSDSVPSAQPEKTKQTTPPSASEPEAFPPPVGEPIAAPAPPTGKHARAEQTATAVNAVTTDEISSNESPSITAAAPMPAHAATATEADTAAAPSSAQTSDSSLPDTDVIEFEVRPVEGGIAVIGEAVSFKQEDGKLYALNEDGETFGIVPAKFASTINDTSTTAEVISKSSGGYFSIKATFTKPTSTHEEAPVTQQLAHAKHSFTSASESSDSGSCVSANSIKKGNNNQSNNPLKNAFENIKQNRIAIVVIVVFVAIVVAAALAPCNHEYAEATCTEPATCTKCGETEGEALGHDYEATETVEATCTDDGYTVYICNRCGESYEGDSVDALGHTVEDWTVDKEATCTETGSKSGVCTVCGETVTESIAKTEHTEGSWETVHEPTVWATSDYVYVDPGQKELTCSVCGELLDEEEITLELTTEEENACMSAASYLDLFAFSYSGLIDQLEHDGFSTDTATFAADNCHANWKEEAVESAESYMELYSFSRAKLIEQLEYVGFTAEQAEYAADEVGL